jgi:nucleotide-binding universal stress UspA family protein
LDTIVKKLQEKASIPISSALPEGEVVDSILELARTQSADLIVMTTHGRGPLSRFWLGSVADGLLRHAAIPVLLVRPPPRTSESGQEATLKRILIPLDGSEFAEQVLKPATALGTLMDAEYTLVRVVAPRLVPDGYPIAAELTPLAQGQLEKRTTEANTCLDGLAECLRSKSLRVQTSVVVSETVAAAILDVAREQRIGLIAIATHGRGGFKRLLLGSVADKIVRGAFTPVLVYRPDR